MTRRTWIKLYIEMLDDITMAQLPDWQWRRAIELFLLAGWNGNDGLLPPVPNMAWRLRISDKKLTESLQALSEVGVVEYKPGGFVPPGAIAAGTNPAASEPGVWYVTNFKEEQNCESYDRVRRFRDRYRNGE